MAKICENAIGKMVLKSNDEIERKRFRDRFKNHGVLYGDRIFDLLRERFDYENMTFSEVIVEEGESFRIIEKANREDIQTERDKGNKLRFVSVVDFRDWVCIQIIER